MAGKGTAARSTEEPMGWDHKQRGAPAGYYYRSRRVNGRSIKEYVGTGPRALQVAQQVADRKAAGLADRRRIEEQRAQVAPAKTVATAFHALVVLLARATLLLGGYRDHHGEWRRHHVH
jgi:hypothetical protein